MTGRVEVIPVPDGMTAEEAYDEIATFGHLLGWRWWHRWTRRRTWAVIQVDDA